MKCTPLQKQVSTVKPIQILIRRPTPRNLQLQIHMQMSMQMKTQMKMQTNTPWRKKANRSKRMGVMTMETLPVLMKSQLKNL